MTRRVLITHASRTGSTAEIAEEMGRVLSDVYAEVRSMDEVDDLTPYHAVILGSAIRDRQWLPEAQAFVTANQPALESKRVALFTVSLTSAMTNPKHHEAVKEWLSPVRLQVDPMAEAYFAGRLELARIPSCWQRLLFRISILLGIWSAGDHRDWPAIRAWAESLRPQLR